MATFTRFGTDPQDEDDGLWVYMKSSNVLKARYFRAPRELEVVFISGGHYVYYGVAPFMWSRFQQAGSKGRWLHQNIKGGYAFSRLG